LVIKAGGKTATGGQGAPSRQLGRGLTHHGVTLGQGGYLGLTALHAMQHGHKTKPRPRQRHKRLHQGNAPLRRAPCAFHVPLHA
jgi:hypothetical protein